MVDLTLADGSILHATDHHPLWDATTNRFTYAIDLHPGEQLQHPDGTLLTLAAVVIRQQNLTAYNLTIADIHTYYAGTARTSNSVLEMGLLRKIERQLPLGVTWLEYNDPVVVLGDENWSLALMCPWQLFIGVDKLTAWTPMTSRMPPERSSVEQS